MANRIPFPSNQNRLKKAGRHSGANTSGLPTGPGVLQNAAPNFKMGKASGGSNRSDGFSAMQRAAKKRLSSQTSKSAFNADYQRNNHTSA